MKIVAFGCRDDEVVYLEKYSQELAIELDYYADHLNMNTVEKAKGADAVSIVGVCTANREVLSQLKDYGIHYLSTRTIGYNQIDLAAAKEFGIRVSNVTYSPYGVANFTVMLILATIRKLNHIIARTHCMDYSLQDVQGRELQNMTVGILGTGRIGSAVAKNLSGFGCKIQAYDPHPSEELKSILTYLSMEEVLETCDILTLHMPLTKDNMYLINRDTIARMKDRVVIINTARGELVDTKALIDGLEQGKVSGAGIDSFENEQEVIHIDHSCNIIKNKDMLLLKAFPNVTVTPHVAFFTDQASDDMVRCSLVGLCQFYRGEKNPWEIQIND